MTKKSNIYIFLIIIILIIISSLFFLKNLIFSKTIENPENVNNFNDVLPNENSIIQNNEYTIDKNITNETEISSFSTSLNGSSENRLTNIKITCQKLNNTIVNPGEIFSFETALGPSTTEDGYKKATMFSNGKEIQALGGGNCQVSSTLYNALLSIPELEIIERHKHGKKVSYVSNGKDAAVAYGQLDFKFKNNLNNKIKLILSVEDNNIITKILKIF